jgi:hypothetical protein
MTMEGSGRKGARRLLELGLVAVLGLGVALGGIALATGDSDGPGINNESDLRAALDKLPYSYTLQEVNLPETAAAFRGYATDRNGLKAAFSVSICKEGDSHGCPVPSLPHVKDDVSISGFGRVSLHDAAGEVIPGESPAQARRRTEILAAIDSTLCHAANTSEYGCSG